MTILQKLKDTFIFRSQPRQIQVGVGEELTKTQLVVSTREEEAKPEKRYCSTCRWLSTRGRLPEIAHQCHYPENSAPYEYENYLGKVTTVYWVKHPRDLNPTGMCTWWEEKENKS